MPASKSSARRRRNSETSEPRTSRAGARSSGKPTSSLSRKHPLPFIAGRGAHLIGRKIRHQAIGGTGQRRERGPRGLSGPRSSLQLAADVFPLVHGAALVRLPVKQGGQVECQRRKDEKQGHH